MGEVLVSTLPLELEATSSNSEAEAVAGTASRAAVVLEALSVGRLLRNDQLPVALGNR